MVEIVSTLAALGTLLIAAVLAVVMAASAFLPSQQPVLRPVLVRRDVRSAKWRG